MQYIEKRKKIDMNLLEKRQVVKNQYKKKKRGKKLLSLSGRSKDVCVCVEMPFTFVLVSSSSSSTPHFLENKREREKIFIDCIRKKKEKFISHSKILNFY